MTSTFSFYLTELANILWKKEDRKYFSKIYSPRAELDQPKISHLFPACHFSELLENKRWDNFFIKMIVLVHVLIRIFRPKGSKIVTKLSKEVEVILANILKSYTTFLMNIHQGRESIIFIKNHSHPLYAFILVKYREEKRAWSNFDDVWERSSKIDLAIF